MPLTRQLAAIMFTDMVGYTALMQENEQLALQRRKYATKIFQASLKKHCGKLLQLYGDGTLSIFSSALNAVLSAVEMQTMFRQDPRIEVRIGIHTGDVLIDPAGIYGDGVNVASRIESLATPGAVFISEKLFDEIKNQEGISAEPLGFFELKNIRQPIQVYAIANQGIVVPKREEVKGKLKQTMNSIAVLPFVNLSADAANEFFCDGITEELINVLAKMDGLQVTSRTSAFAFKGKNEDVRAIAVKLNVQRIIEGSVRKAGNKVRITAQLINAADGYHIWSETYDRDLEDIFEVQDDLSRAIANKLRANLTTNGHESQLVKAPTQNLDAYKKYLQGVHLYVSLSPQNKNTAIELFREAIQLDPKMANAHGMLAFAYTFMGQTGVMNAKEAISLVNHHASLASEYDPDNVISLLAQCSVKFFLEWDWAHAYELVQRALELNPGDPLGHAMMAEYHHLFLEDDKAIDEMMIAYRLNPLSSDTISQLARLYMIAEKFEEAAKYAKEANALNPENIAAVNVMGYTTGLLGDWNAAAELFENTNRTLGNFPMILMGLGYSYARLNKQDETMRIISRLEKMKQEQPDANLEFMLAFLYVTINNLEKFYEYYDICISRKSFWAIELYASRPMKPIWYDPHVIDSRKKLGLPVLKCASALQTENDKSVMQLEKAN